MSPRSHVHIAARLLVYGLPLLITQVNIENAVRVRFRPKPSLKLLGSLRRAGLRFVIEGFWFSTYLLLDDFSFPERGPDRYEVQNCKSNPANTHKKLPEDVRKAGSDTSRGISSPLPKSHRKPQPCLPCSLSAEHSLFFEENTAKLKSDPYPRT